MTFRRAKAEVAAFRHLIVLDDHVRLPGRFFGRMTAAILAAL
jgi:hypothetical protein